MRRVQVCRHSSALLHSISWAHFATGLICRYGYCNLEFQAPLSCRTAKSALFDRSLGAKTQDRLSIFPELLAIVGGKKWGPQTMSPTAPCASALAWLCWCEWSSKSRWNGQV